MEILDTTRGATRRGPRRTPTPRHPRAAAIALLVCAGLGAASGCGEIADPYPRELSPNLVITQTPAFGAQVATADADSVILEFDRPMERGSVQSVQRVSFLLPLALRGFDGRWDDDDSRVTFSLSEFPVQPGTTYEARFIGLRAADGELYNGGPLNLRFRTKGMPDLFPMRPHPRVATRVLCLREDGASECLAGTMHVESAGTDSLHMRSTCEDCTGARLDWFRRTAGVVEWLGWDEVDRDDNVLRRVRWPEPPRLVGRLTARGDAFDAPAQTASDGTRLEGWRAVHASWESPVADVRVGPRVVEVVFSGSAVLDLDYTLRDPGGVVETHDERWWLYSGVGIVRRDVRIARDDGSPPRRVIESFMPSLINFAY